MEQRASIYLVCLKNTEYGYYPERIDPNIIIRMLFDGRESCAMGGEIIQELTMPPAHSLTIRNSC